MTTKKTTDGVGKKIVEALKKQSEPEIQEKEEVLEQTDELMESDLAYDLPTTEEENKDYVDDIFAENTEEEQQQVTEEEPEEVIQEESHDSSFDFLNNSSFDKTFPQAFQEPEQPFQNTEINTNNVKILNNLINQLPAGISKQTGAQIIKQTMEALGISMKTVLGEAQQIQEQISSSSNDCLNAIQEYKRQIHSMEKQVQIYHKQYNALNELISLFVQTEHFTK